jgi:Probable sensor domain DACNV
MITGCMKFPEYPAELAKLVFDEWKNNPDVSYYAPSECLPLAVLAKLFHICFFASLKREEDRLIQFSVVLCSPSKLEQSPFRFSKFTKTFNLMRFDKPQSLSINRLVRIAPACDAEKTLILVSYDEGARELQLWGIVDVGWRTGGENLALAELRVRVSGPGELRIMLHRRHLCTYKDGQIALADKSLVNTGCIYQFFRQTSLDFCREVMATSDPTFFDVEINERDYRAIGYLSTVQDLIRRVEDLKHGGCILVVPEDQSPDAISDVNIKYQCRDQSIWSCLKGRWTLHDKYYQALERRGEKPINADEFARLQGAREDVENGLHDSLDTLARLTTVDGAVIMTRKFELLGFGAVVQFQHKAVYKVMRCEDRQAERSSEVMIENYGTRHRSAFDFCYNNSPSVAVVVSQDGGVKMITRIGESVYFWENSLFDVSLGLFHEGYLNIQENQSAAQSVR